MTKPINKPILSSDYLGIALSTKFIITITVWFVYIMQSPTTSPPNLDLSEFIFCGRISKLRLQKERWKSMTPLSVSKRTFFSLPISMQISKLELTQSILFPLCGEHPRKIYSGSSIENPIQKPILEKLALALWSFS